MMLEGRIIKALSGFYYVEAAGSVFECRERGKLRRGESMPLVGDLARLTESGNGKGVLEELLPRRNAFVRPAVCNLDALVIFCSNVIPVTEPFLIDRVTAIAGNQSVPVILCVNKTDENVPDLLTETYLHAGYRAIRTSAVTGAGIEILREAIHGRTVAFTGNSGVGKSSVLNCLQPDFQIRTGEVSNKLGRGRHTTSHVELYCLEDGTYVADTPGFSSFDTDQMDWILKENLQFAFPDFAPFLGACQFHDCAHRKEPGCLVRRAVEAGKIEGSRYDSYLRLYAQTVGRKEKYK
ncbi:MAG: ribosome small subunit-dependent GTPase A [Oscillospiraceae bacterium]|nr:ribosome small subunit-dependent GTPase A [Oscillospiraceae bacterium]